MPVNSNFKKLLQQGSKPMTLQYWCDTLTNWAMKSQKIKLASSVGQYNPVTGGIIGGSYGHMKWTIYMNCSHGSVGLRVSHL